MIDREPFDGKSALITGIAGTVGRALARELGKTGLHKIIGLDNNESSLFFAEQENSTEFIPVLGDVRDKETLIRACRDVDILFHLAALKHVPLCETNPLEAIKTNILGVKNVIDAALVNNVLQVINTSTDKAVNPFNVMGTSKLMGEQLIRAANLSPSKTKFSSIRFGNVLGSSGSVIPIFKEQLSQGVPLTLTSKKMTRFVMTLDEAANLVVESALLAEGGDTYVTKMKAIRVEELAEVMIEELTAGGSISKSSYRIREIGARPGEKLFEELMSSEEARRSKELDNHYVIMPALTDIYDTGGTGEEAVEAVQAPYNSATQEAMTKGELRIYLRKHSII